MTKTFYVRTPWDAPGQQPAEVAVADDNQSIREAFKHLVPRDVNEWNVTDKNGRDVTSIVARDLEDKSVMFIAPAVAG